MGEITRNHFYTVDMDKPLMRQDCGVLLAEGDNNGDRFSFALNRGGVALALDNAVSVTMYFVRQDGFTVFLDGECTGNRVNVTLPAHCYSVEGRFSLAVKASLTGETVTIAVIDGFIRSTYTGSIADPTEAIPSLDELFAHIEAMEAATEATKAATENAKTVTNAAINTMLDLMQTAAPVIIQSLDGDGIVSVSDSAERSLSGLSVYGKTTQDGTPTPESPVTMVNAGADGNVSVTLAGKNLFQDRRDSKADATSNGITFVTNADGTFTANGTNASESRSTMTITPTGKWLYLPAGTYTVSSGLPNSDAYFQLSHNDEPSSSGSTAVYVYGTPKTITLDKPKWCWLGVNVVAGKTAENLVFKPQIEVGSAATEYEPYREYQTMTAATPNGLPGIPVTSGGNYIDASGQRWVCDEIDYTRKVHVKRVGKITLDGTQSSYYMESASLFRVTLADGVIKPAEEQNAFCTHYLFSKAANANVPDKHFKVHAVLGEGKDYVYLKDSRYTSNAAWKAALAANPVTVYYILATPIETPLSPEELTGSTSLTAQYPNTTVFNDAGAGMKMDYIADTKIYIDQRIAALLNA